MAKLTETPKTGEDQNYGDENRPTEESDVYVQTRFFRDTFCPCGANVRRKLRYFFVPNSSGHKRN